MHRLKSRLAITCSLLACIASGQAVLAQPAAAAAPAAGAYVCPDFTLTSYTLSQTSSTVSEPFSTESGTADCRAGVTDYPHTTLDIEGTATVTCGGGLVVTGTLTISDGTNPAVSTSAFLTFDRTGSGTEGAPTPDPGTLTLGSGQQGAVAATMTTGVPFHTPIDDLCSRIPTELLTVTIQGSLGPGNSTTNSTVNTAAWTVYRYPDLLANSVFAVENGTAVTGGTTDDTTGDCDPPDQSLTLSPSESVKDVREVAINPITCQFIVETGIPNSSVVAADAANDANAASQLNDSASDLTNTGLIYARSRGYWRTWFEDPVGIDVAVVGVGTDWHWSNVGSCCVLPPVTNSVHYHWYDPSGWGLFQHNWQQSYNSTQTTSSVYAHFANGSWPPCLGHETHITFNRTTLNGRWDGSMYATVHAIKRGLNVPGCLRSLSFRHRLQYLH
jgi:hypothetical protein